MGKGYKPRMMAEEIRKVVSDMLIRGDLKNPAFNNLIGVSGVEVTNDGSYATLYVTVLSYDPKKTLSDEDKKAVLDAFDKVKGYIRSEIGKRVKVRYVPELIFKLDGSFDYGLKMDKILDSLDIKHDDTVVSEEEIDEFAEELD